jgi:hypothetical protein
MSELVGVGLPLPDCDIHLRPDGSVEHGAYFDDPVRLHLVLGADVSPEHEQAIIDACHEPADELGPVPVPEADRRSLWVWTLLTRQPIPAIGITLWLRSAKVRLPDVSWLVHHDAQQLCGECARDLGIRAIATNDVLAGQQGQSLQARIIMVGRDHRVLAITHAACHGLLAAVWQEQLATCCLGQEEDGLVGPQIDEFPTIMHHVVGQPHLMQPQDLIAHLVRDGWREHSRERVQRIRRQAARRRRGR